jgi:hypothetical protein
MPPYHRPFQHVHYRRKRPRQLPRLEDADHIGKEYDAASARGDGGFALEDVDRMAELGEADGGGEAGEACANDDDFEGAGGEGEGPIVEGSTVDEMERNTRDLRGRVGMDAR